MGSKSRGVLVPLPSDVRGEVDNIGLLEIIRGGFKPAASLIAGSRSFKLDWAGLNQPSAEIPTSFRGANLRRS